MNHLLDTDPISITKHRSTGPPKLRCFSCHVPSTPTDFGSGTKCTVNSIASGATR